MDASPQFLLGLGTALIFALIQLAHFASVFVKVLTATWHFQFSTLLGWPDSFCILTFCMAIQALVEFDAMYPFVFCDTSHQNNSPLGTAPARGCPLYYGSTCRLAGSSLSNIADINPCLTGLSSRLISHLTVRAKEASMSGWEVFSMPDLVEKRLALPILTEAALYDLGKSSSIPFRRPQSFLRSTCAGLGYQIIVKD
jgi:hypothetical protein